MLFYEPLFLTIFPAVYAFYLLVSGASAKKCTLLIVSTLFYVWGEPVFVLVLLASTAIDYALSFYLSDPTPARTRRLALQLLRSSMLLIATFCFFGALRYLPLAEASAITFLAPIFIVLLSGPLLGERPTRPRWVASITGFAGIVILLSEVPKTFTTCQIFHCRFIQPG